MPLSKIRADFFLLCIKVWYTFAMVHFLEDTNPAPVWLQEKFKTVLQLANGHIVVVKFNVTSCDSEGYNFDTEAVLSHFGNAILADKETAYGDYLSIASTIAHVLNTRMVEIAEEVISHVDLSLKILARISSQNYAEAYLLTVKLSKRLLAFGDHADNIWASWLWKVVQTLKSEGGMEFGVNVAI